MQRSDTKLAEVTQELLIWENLENLYHYIVLTATMEIILMIPLIMFKKQQQKMKMMITNYNSYKTIKRNATTWCARAPRVAN